MGSILVTLGLADDESEHHQPYGKTEYWENRYTKDITPFDWYQRWVGIKGAVKDVIPAGSRVLDLGCGTSRLGEEMYNDGFRDITNIDISHTVVQKMQEKYKGRHGMIYVHMDAMHMTFEKHCYNVIIDKATLDSILCASGSADNGPKVLSEIARVLKWDGVFISVSYRPPAVRLPLLDNPKYGWRVEVKTIRRVLAKRPLPKPEASDKDDEDEAEEPSAEHGQRELLEQGDRPSAEAREAAGAAEAKGKAKGKAKDEEEDNKEVHYLYICQKGGVGKLGGAAPSR